MENKTLITEFYAAFSRGNAEEILQYVTDDFIMHVPGQGLNAGEYWGKEGFKKFLDNIASYGGGEFSVSVPTVAINDDVIYTREQIIMNRKANPAEMWTLRLIMEYRLKDNLISEAWTIPMDPDIYDAFWTPGAAFKAPKSIEKSVVTINTDQSEDKVSKNFDHVEAFYHYFWKNDLNSMSKLATPDLVFTVPGSSFLAGYYQNWEGYVDFRSRLLSNVSGDKYKLEIDSIAASENEVFVKEYIRMNRSWDPEVQTSYVILNFIMKDGMIIQINDVPVDSIPYDAFFTKPVNQ
ncbi:nuclear transport factor 2 family protein [Acinetobacter sp. 194]|uniref:nuclear transport factor 2 family protein n=1 Tax=Acinetobacter shaoyimingii TaxID=2715164 RepID=UPI001407E59F|nr:nuclear transport factor 2 family protein [Acinetobacter shaoyimingii]NHB59026.1 nuclear transport factor 2 family protein [Acinetobacter shaoyimingii]